RVSSKLRFGRARNDASDHRPTARPIRTEMTPTPPSARVRARRLRRIAARRDRHDDASHRRALCLSPKTVQSYSYQIKAKLGVETDAHLVWPPDRTERVIAAP